MSRKLNQGEIKLLAVIAQHAPVSMPVLRGEDPRPKDLRKLKARVEDLMHAGAVRLAKIGRKSSGMVEPTEAGRAILARQAIEATPRAAAPIGSRPSERIRPDSYTGAELRPYTGRPNALVAFTLPSLVDGKRVERTRGPLIMASTKPDRVLDGRSRGL